MDNFNGIVYLSEEQYREKFNAKTLDENTQYETPQDPVYTKDETDALLEELASKIKIPTKTSELENDSNFVTSEELANIQVSVPVRNFIEV
jgi:hypothetical protein